VTLASYQFGHWLLQLAAIIDDEHPGYPHYAEGGARTSTQTTSREKRWKPT
jgi:hypothetical protein